MSCSGRCHENSMSEVENDSEDSSIPQFRTAAV